jgi:hypothetical protein
MVFTIYTDKTGELYAAKNEIDSVPKFHLSQSKHLTSQYNVAVHSVQNNKTAHVENIGLKLLFLSRFSIQFVKLALALLLMELNTLGITKERGIHVLCIYLLQN